MNFNMNLILKNTTGHKRLLFHVHGTPQGLLTFSGTGYELLYLVVIWWLEADGIPDHTDI